MHLFHLSALCQLGCRIIDEGMGDEVQEVGDPKAGSSNTDVLSARNRDLHLTAQANHHL
jgi:hypothetical protein